MNYIKSLCVNFLIVFFADHILPGIVVMDQTKLPHFGGDMIMALTLGFLNSLIFPILRLIQGEVSGLKIALVAFILNFAAYAAVKFLPLGIGITSIEGYVLAAAVVSVGSFLTNFFEMKASSSDRDPIE